MSVDPAQDADCFWFPNLEKCQEIDKESDKTTEVVPAGPIEQTKPETESEFLMPIMGQIAYLTVAMLAFSAHFL